MNKQLTQEIINHIFSSFFILNSSNFDSHRFKSLKSQDYLLFEKISFENSEGATLKNNIWGVQFTIEENDLKVILADCSVDDQIEEYALLIKLKDAPAYGLYSAYSTNNENTDHCPLIAVSVDGLNWMQCNTYLQATFLAGMENAKDMSYAQAKCKDYKEHYDLMLSFIKYHDQIYGDED